MGTSVTCFVVAPQTTSELIQDLQRIFRTTGERSLEGVFSIPLPVAKSRPPESALQQISKIHQVNIFWLAMSSVTDSLHYIHWSEGRLVRALGYGCFEEERTWERVDGEPESWETAAIFTQEGLITALSCVSTPAEQAELRELWSRGNPKLGGFEPTVDAREVARAAALYYHLPGWE